MNFTRYIILVSIAFLLSTCGAGLNTQLAETNNIRFTENATDITVPRDGRDPCKQYEGYIPDPGNLDHTPMKYIRVNLHFMDSKTGTHNYSREEGLQFAFDVIDGCNERLANNVQMNLPLGNSTPVLPTRYRLVLTGMPDEKEDYGIYFHEDPELYYYIHGKNTNRTRREVIERYERQKDSVINIFFMPHHPDSVKSKTYKAAETGIMLGGSIKIAQVWSKKPPLWKTLGLLNHEVGHAIGLGHTWRGYDGCEDTPKHANCFYYTDEPPCDKEVSNNMMDYNSWQHALTPCQIGKVHRAITNVRSRIRRYTIPDWCEGGKELLEITGDVTWDGARDLPGGGIVIANDASLRLNCRLALARDARIVVAPRGKLILDGAHLHNACHAEWYGVEVQTKGEETGTVEIITPPLIENCQNPLPDPDAILDTTR